MEQLFVPILLRVLIAEELIDKQLNEDARNPPPHHNFFKKEFPTSSKKENYGTKHLRLIFKKLLFIVVYSLWGPLRHLYVSCA